MRPPLLIVTLLSLLFASHGFCAAEKMAKLDIDGASREQRSNIRAHVGEIRVSQLNNAFKISRSVEKKARDAMQALGYFAPSFKVEIKDRTIRLQVEAGPETRVGSVDLALTGDGAGLQALAPAASRLRELQGQRLASAEYEKRKSALRSAARRNGYIDAAFHKHQVRVDRRLHSAAIELNFDTGQLYYLGDFSLSEVPIRAARMNSLVRWKAGEVYSSEKLDALQRRLLDSGYFASVVLEQQPDPQSRTVDVEALIAMNAPNRFRTGVGFGTDTGPRAKLTWEKPWINSAGHSTRFELSGSAVRQGFKAAYKVPSIKRPDTHWQGEFDIVEEDIEDTRSSQQQLGLAYLTPLPRGWRGSFYSKYLRERYTQGSERGRSELLLPGANASLTRSRGGLIPSWGFRVSGSVEGAHDGLLSDATLLRLTFDTRFIQSYRRHRLLLGSQLGSLFLPGHTNLEDIPSSLRFFAGGDQSIRGYDYKSIAPRDANGELVGGQYLAVAKAEYNYRLSRQWRAALFVDGGSAFNNESDRWYLGPGFGLHWLSPIGALRFDIGFAASEDQQITLHINIGPEL